MGILAKASCPVIAAFLSVIHLAQKYVSRLEAATNKPKAFSTSYDVGNAFFASNIKRSVRTAAMIIAIAASYISS